MLARAERLVSAADYRRVVRRGRRASSAVMTVYSATGSDPGTWRFGFIVSRAVGNAVVRNRVRRRLKAICHTMRTEQHDHESSFDIVFRAHPAAGSADFAELEQEATTLLTRSVSLSGGAHR